MYVTSLTKSWASPFLSTSLKYPKHYQLSIVPLNVSQFCLAHSNIIVLVPIQWKAMIGLNHWINKRACQEVWDTQADMIRGSTGLVGKTKKVALAVHPPRQKNPQGALPQQPPTPPPVPLKEPLRSICKALLSFSLVNLSTLSSYIFKHILTSTTSTYQKELGEKTESEKASAF